MGETTEAQAAPAKKSVALSGVVAGNTGICTVGRAGNDLHYRGYDVTALAEHASFEEVAYLLLYERLPTLTQLIQYRKKLKTLRGLPVALKPVLENLPASAHPMDVLHVGNATLGTILPEAKDQNIPGARDIADRLISIFPSILLYWYHWSHNGRRIETETDDDTIAGHFLHLLHGKLPSELYVRSMDRSLILYAEHEFNASTFTARTIAGTRSDIYSCIGGAIGALRGPKHGGANEASYGIQARYHDVEEAEAEAARAIVRAKWEARRQELLETAIRAWGEETALRLRAREAKLGDTEDMVRFAFGEPEAIDEKVLKTKTKRTFKYQALGGRGYAVKIHLDDGEVVGWEK